MTTFDTAPSDTAPSDTAPSDTALSTTSGQADALSAAIGKQLHMPLPEVRATVEEERMHRKVQLAATFRMFSKAGLDEGVAGHVTARDPEFTDSYWVNPFGMHFSLVKQSDLVRVDHSGQVVEGDRAVNGAAVAIHCAVHAARPDVVAAAHAHGPYGKTLSSLPMSIEPLTQDACAFYDDVGVFNDYSGVVLDAEEGRRIGAALGDHKAVILRNHGMLTVGETVESAAWWFLTLERTAQCQLMAYAAGTPIKIGHDAAVQTRGQVGFELAGWFQFQPIWQRISKDNPDIWD